MMEYQGKQHFAEVTAEGIIHEGVALKSASQLARRVAKNTSRNAWRDLWIRRPHDKTWIQAGILRERESE